MVKTKVLDNFTLEVAFFFNSTNLKNVCLRAKNVLLSIFRSHFLTKMVFLQSRIIEIFSAHENSFFHHIFLSQLANKQLFKAARLIIIYVYAFEDIENVNSIYICMYSCVLNRFTYSLSY